MYVPTYIHVYKYRYIHIQHTRVCTRTYGHLNKWIHTQGNSLSSVVSIREANFQKETHIPMHILDRIGMLHLIS